MEIESILAKEQFKSIVLEYYKCIITTNANGYEAMKRVVYDKYINEDSTMLGKILIHAFNTWKENLKVLNEAELSRLESMDSDILDAIEFYTSIEDIDSIARLKEVIAKDDNYKVLIKNEIEPISIGDDFEIATSFKHLNYDTVILLPKFTDDNLNAYKDLIVELISKDIPVVIEQNLIYLEKDILDDVMKIIIKLDNSYDNIWLYNSHKLPFFESYDCMNIAYTEDYDEYISKRIKALEHAIILSIKYQLSEAIKIYEVKDDVDNEKVTLIKSFYKMIKEDIEKLKNDLIYQEMENKKELGSDYKPSEGYLEIEAIYKYPTKFKKSIEDYIDTVFKNILVPEKVNEDNELMYEGKILSYFTTSQIKYIRYAIPYFMEIDIDDLHNKFEAIFKLRMQKYGIDKIDIKADHNLDEDNKFESDKPKDTVIGYNNISYGISDILSDDDIIIETEYEYKPEVTDAYEDIDIEYSDITIRLRILKEKVLNVEGKNFNIIKFDAFELEDDGDEIDICNDCYISIDRQILKDTDELSIRIKTVIINRLLDDDKMVEIIRQRAGFIGVFELDIENKKLKAYSNMEIIENIRKGNI